MTLIFMILMMMIIMLVEKNYAEDTVILDNQ